MGAMATSKGSDARSTVAAFPPLAENLFQYPGCKVSSVAYCARMDWQQAVSLAIVGVTAIMFLRSGLIRRRFSASRHTHCGCGGSTAASGSVIFRVRKGERPQIIVRPN